MTPKRYSLADIARELQVSVSLVSLVLNNRHREQRISSQTAERILTYCREIGYQPNIHTKRMRSRIVRNVMFYANVSVDNTEFDHVLFRVLNGVIAEADQHKVSVTVYSGSLEHAEKRLLGSLRSSEVDGVICYGNEFPNYLQDIIINERRQVVAVSSSGGRGIHTVNLNDREIAREMVQKLLIPKGRKRYLYLGGTAVSFPGQERYAGFREALKENGIPFSDDQYFECRFRGHIASEKIEELLASGTPLPDAIVCANDRMAIGVIKTLQKHHIDVPGTVSVCGGDGIDAGLFMTPQLTSFKYTGFELGKAAFRLLWNKVNGGNAENEVIAAELQPGESV